MTTKAKFVDKIDSSALAFLPSVGPAAYPVSLVHMPRQRLRRHRVELGEVIRHRGSPLLSTQSAATMGRDHWETGCRLSHRVFRIRK